MNEESEEFLYSRLKHLPLGDCPDCGRVIIYNSRCGKCAGEYWLPAGYINRDWVRKCNKESST